MTSPAPGWYPDPGGTAPFRWWNGQAWTTATSDGAPPAPAQPSAPAAPTAPTTTATPAGQFGAVDPNAAAAEDNATAYGTKSPFDASGASQYSRARAQQSDRTDTFFHHNQYAMWTFIVGAIYLLIVIATGFAFVGVVPAWTAYQSFTRGEQLAPIAIGAAVIAVVVGIASFTNAF